MDWSNDESMRRVARFFTSARGIAEEAGEEMDYLLFAFGRDTGKIIRISSAENHDEDVEMSERAKHADETIGRADALRRAEGWEDE